MPAQGSISQSFGATDEPRDSGTLCLGHRYAHFNKGIDIACSSGTPVFAVAGGVVRAAGPSNTGWDTVVWVEDAHGVTHNYGHLSAVLVSLGEEVERGQEIARSGLARTYTRPLAIIVSAIWMALRAAPLRRLSETSQRARPAGWEMSRRMRPT